MLNVLEGTPSALETMFTGIGTVITKMIETLGTVTTGLLANNIFMIVMGVVFFSIVMGVVYSLVAKVRKRGR